MLDSRPADYHPFVLAFVCKSSSSVVLTAQNYKIIL